jgi:phosphatidate cytidylyltransferase
VLTRIVSGLLMAAAIISVLIFTPPWGLGLVVLAASFLVSAEYVTITRGKDADALDRILFQIAVLLCIAWPVLGEYVKVYSAEVAVACAFFLLALARLFRPDPIEKSVQRLALDFLGVAYMGLTFPLIFLLRDRDHGHGGWVVLLVMAITFGSDTGAYFAGRFLGRHKLYEKISPKKTVEGLVGGLAAAVGACFLARAWFPYMPWLTPAHCFGLGILGAGFGALGDLFESMLKRAYGVKDSGTLIPGHGGMLDRIDGLLFAGPVAWLYLEIIAPR